MQTFVSRGKKDSSGSNYILFSMARMRGVPHGPGGYCRRELGWRSLEGISTIKGCRRYCQGQELGGYCRAHVKELHCPEIDPGTTPHPRGKKSSGTRAAAGLGLWSRCFSHVQLLKRLPQKSCSKDQSISQHHINFQSQGRELH